MSVSGNYTLMINEYEASLSYPLIVFLNIDPLEYDLKNREFYLERAIEAAAALCVMTSRDRQALGLMLHSSPHEKGESISPSAFALIPILKKLAVVERRTVEVDHRTVEAVTHDGNGEPHGRSEEPQPQCPGSVERLLKDGKTLPFGTRLFYVGPSLEDRHYRTLESLKRSRISLEYLLIDEKTLPSRGGHYQIKERGYEII